MNRSTRAVAACVAAMLCAVVNAKPVCDRTLEHEAGLDRLRTAMAHDRFIGYVPTSLRIVDGRVHRAEPASIREDLRVLRGRFDALVTYGAANGAEAIPAIAADLGYRALIIGVYDPFDPQEVQAALTAVRAHPQLVVGLSLGNEMVFGHRREFEQLAARLREVRKQLPGVPLTTTEPFHLFLEPRAAELLERSDFMLVNVHPVFQPWFRGAAAADSTQFVVNVVDRLGGTFCGPILVKETGTPTAPAAQGYTPQLQAAFYQTLRERFPASTQRAFVYFSAFDAPWRAQDASPVPGPHPEEAHWGLYEADRRPKPVVDLVPLLKR